MEFPRLRLQGIEKGARGGRIQPTTASIILLRQPAKSISGCKGECGTRHLIHGPTGEFSSDFFAQTAQKFPSEAFEHL